MSVKIKKKNEVPPTVRRARIPADLSYLTNTDYGQEMLRLVAEIAEEQGRRTTKEINQLLGLLRGDTTHADVS